MSKDILNIVIELEQYPSIKVGGLEIVKEVKRILEEDMKHVKIIYFEYMPGVK